MGKQRKGGGLNTGPGKSRDPNRFHEASEEVVSIVPPTEPEKVEKKPRRNDSCPCDSGRKFKHCCGKPDRYAAYEHMDEHPTMLSGPYADDATPVDENA